MLEWVRKAGRAQRRPRGVGARLIATLSGGQVIAGRGGAHVPGAHPIPPHSIRRFGGSQKKCREESHWLPLTGILLAHPVLSGIDGMLPCLSCSSCRVAWTSGSKRVA